MLIKMHHQIQKILLSWFKKELYKSHTIREAAPMLMTDVGDEM